VKRLPVAAFVALAIATAAAFFLVQSLKVSTPLIAGLPKPHPARINPVSGGVCDLRGHDGVVATDYRRMTISFLLLNQADDVNVAMVTTGGTVVDTIARDRHMAINRRARFVWDGRRADGALAPSGTYDVQVTLVHQHRTVRIADADTGALEPVTVEDSPTPIRITGVRADGVEPAVIPQTTGRPVAIHFTRIATHLPTIRIYRTDVPGTPLVDTFHATSLHTAFWDGRLADGRPAPQGTYLTSVTALDGACASSTFPVTIPPAVGSTPHSGVTVRYLAAQPPLTAVAPGSAATVEVDSRRHAYTWTLHRVGSRAALESGRSSAVGLRVPVPGGSDGLYELSLAWGSHRTAVPIVGGVSGVGGGSGSSPGGSGGSGPTAGRVLVVLPALTWQGDNPVDDDGDGIPNTLLAGTPIQLARPFTDGLPAGFASEAGLITYLRAAGLRFSLATDLSLVSGGATLLHGYSGVVFAGSETWLPAATTTALSTWAQQGGHVLSLGIGALQRTVTVSGGEAMDPSSAHGVDALQARPEGLRTTAGSLLLVDRNGQSLFASRSEALSGFRSFQAFGPVQAPARLLTSVGVSAGTPAVIGYALGRGAVVDVGLPGFGSALSHNVTAQGFVGRVWALLLR
jgi:flagellar hook assembly protein FlgD